MAYKITVHPDSLPVFFRIQPFRLLPVRGFPFLKEKDICGNFRPCILFKSGIGKAHCAQEFRPFCQVLPCRAVPLIHGSLRCDECCNPPGLQLVNGFCKEIIMD